MSESTFEYPRFIGVSKQGDLRKIPDGYYPVFLNFDSDDDGILHLRQGFKSISSTDTHSFWSNDRISLCVQSGVLKRVTIDPNSYAISYATLLSGLGSNRMNYTFVKDIVFFTNNDVIGKIENDTATLFTDPAKTHKGVMPAGHLIEYWDSRLWVARNNEIIPSDATFPSFRDKRHNAVPLEGKVRMLKSVSDGLYVSDTKQCFFLAGGAGNPPLFRYTRVSETPCIENMAVTLGGDEIGKGINHKVVLWATKDGCYLGMPQGVVKRVTDRHFGIEAATRGSVLAVLRQIDDIDTQYYQLIGSYDMPNGYGGIMAELELPALMVAGTISVA